MRLLWLLALVFGAGQAMADIASPSGNVDPGPAPAPLSVWKSGDAGAVDHLQSGLVCPARIDGYARTEVSVFDRFGLDVGCGFKAGTSLITLYLTRRNGSDLAAALVEAKRELLQYGAARRPQEVSETRSSTAGLDWTVVLYAEDGGLHSAIWIADLSGWTLEYRVTYVATDEPRVLTELAAVTAVVKASAGAQLALCARRPPPARKGTAVSDRKDLEASSMMTSVLRAAAMVIAQEGRATPDAPTTWCVEQANTLEGKGMLFWRGVTADGADAVADRITLMTNGPPLALMLAPGTLEALIAKARGGKDKPPRWIATLDRDDRTVIYGYFDGRPPADAVQSLFLAIVKGTAKSTGSYAAKGKSITIGVPQSQ